MTAIFSITGPIFALIALGWGLVRGEVFDAATARALGRYVVTLALPALIFRAVAARDLGSFADPAYLGAYLTGSLAVFALGYVLARRAGGNGSAATFQGMGMACANTGFMGYPILLIALPRIADTALALNMIVENLVMMPMILLLAERARGDRHALGPTLRRVVLNPIVLALLAGLLVALTPLAVPGPVGHAVDLVAGSSAAVSLLVIGGSLAGVPLTGALGPVALTTAGKLLLHPLAVAVGFAILAALGPGCSPELASAGILLAAMPAMGIYPILAGQYGQGATAALAMLTMTVLSFFTVGSLLWTFASLPG